MDSVLIESPIPAKSPNFGLAFKPSYDSMLKESIDRFLTSVHNETLDFSTFRSIFSRLLQSSADPPLEVIWFYSAINYHESLSSSKTFVDRVTAIKNLLQLFTACSASCSGLKSIALLAPAVSDIYNCVVSERERFGGKEASKLKRKVEGLIEGVLGYVNICSGKGCNGEDSGTELLPCFLDCVRVWTVGECGNGSGLEVFFPLASDEIREKFKEVGCGIGYLAGVVIAEAFLLWLCFKVQTGGGSKELQKELRVWAISSVTVFQNQVFFEILLRLLLEPKLPIISLLDSQDEHVVRDILYDVVILVNYSFLDSGMDMDQHYDYVRCIAIRKLIVTHDAIQLAREKADHGKAISYINEFSTSSLPSQMIKWVTNQIGMQSLKKPDANTPQALIKWLGGLEKQGFIRFSDDIALKLHTTLTLDGSKVAASEVSMFTLENNKETDANLFFIDNKGDAAEDAEMQPTDAAFLAAAKSMKSPATNRRRKRKELGGERESRMKFIKYKVHVSSMKDYLPSSLGADGMDSESDVDNPLSDEEMEEN